MGTTVGETAVMNAIDLAGRVAVITGGAIGLGHATAQRILASGANPVLWDRDEAALANAKKDGFATTVMDVSDVASVDRALAYTLATHDKIDILINSAGIGGTNAKVWDMSIDDWRRVVDIDLTGTFLCCRAVLPQMIEAGYGRIVNISSIAGKIGGICAGPAYAASKAGVMCLTKSFSKALAKFNILVNSVSPGQIDTDLNKLFPEDMNRIFMEAIPLGHYGQPEDIAEAVAFLCSDKARWITGEIFNVDGGEAAMVS